MMKKLSLLLVLASSLSAFAADVEFFEVSTAGSTTKLKAGESGKLVISISTKNGGHVSDEAPLKIELSSKESKLAKDKLSLADSVSPSKSDPRFEVPFTPTAQGPTTVEAKMTFFICSEKQCARQTKTLSFPVEVM